MIKDAQFGDLTPNSSSKRVMWTQKRQKRTWKLPSGLTTGTLFCPGETAGHTWKAEDILDRGQRDEGSSPTKS